MKYAELRIRLAAELAVLLPEPDEPRTDGELVQSLFSTTARLLDELLRDDPHWDQPYAWIDGILSANVTRNQAQVLLTGSAVLVDGDKHRLSAVEAELIPHPLRSVIRFAGEDGAIPFGSRGEPPAPAEWPFEFEVRLPNPRDPEAMPGLDRADFPHACEAMLIGLSDPRVPIKYSPKLRQYDLPDLGGGPAAQMITHCPWCGEKLPEPLGEAWFDRLDELGLEPDDPAVPAELQTDAWWRQSDL